MPAPPLVSEPAMVRTIGDLVESVAAVTKTSWRSKQDRVAASLRRHYPDQVCGYFSASAVTPLGTPSKNFSVGVAAGAVYPANFVSILAGAAGRHTGVTVFP